MLKKVTRGQDFYGKLILTSFPKIRQNVDPCTHDLHNFSRGHLLKSANIRKRISVFTLDIKASSDIRSFSKDEGASSIPNSFPSQRVNEPHLCPY